jgi:hypothetical protein
MPTTHADIADLVAGERRYLLHGPHDISRGCVIALRGIIPGSELEQRGLRRQWDKGAQRTRDGYVYLGRASYLSECVMDVEPMFRVDVTRLDAARFACDEDHVSIYTTGERTEDMRIADLVPDCFRVVRTHTGYRVSDQVRHIRGSRLPRPITRRSSLDQGRWANRADVAPVLADADFVRASLTIGSLAHKGAIAPELLEVNDHWLKLAVEGMWGSRNYMVSSIQSMCSLVATLTLVSDARAAEVAEQLIQTRYLSGVSAATLLRHLTTPEGARDYAIDTERDLIEECAREAA